MLETYGLPFELKENLGPNQPTLWKVINGISGPTKKGTVLLGSE